MAPHSDGSLVQETEVKTLRVKIVNSNMQVFQRNTNIHLKVFNKSPTSFRWPPQALWSGDSNQWLIPHHALGTGEEFSLQVLKEWWTSAELCKSEGGENEKGRGQSQKNKNRYSIMKRIREKCSSIYLQSAELLSLIAGYLSVNEFSQQKLSELWMLKEGQRKTNLVRYFTHWLYWAPLNKGLTERAGGAEATFH